MMFSNDTVPPSPPFIERSEVSWLGSKDFCLLLFELQNGSIDFNAVIDKRLKITQLMGDK